MKVIHGSQGFANSKISNAIRANYIKNNIDKTVNVALWLQKEYESNHDWVGKMSHWELCKEIYFGHRDKYYINRYECARDNEK